MTATSASRSSRWSTPSFLLAAFVAAYYGCVRLSAIFVIDARAVTAVWLPSGLVLGVLLHAPRRRWAAILAAVALVNLATALSMGASAQPAVLFSVVDALEGWLAATLVLRRLRRPPVMTCLRDVVTVFLLAVGVTLPVTAVGGAAVAAGAGMGTFGNAWLAWWLSNGIGMLLVTPVVLALVQQRIRFTPTASAHVELAALYSALTLLTYWVFSQTAIAPSVFALPYITFPVLIWAAMRFGPFHAGLSSLVVALLAGSQTGHGHGPFVILAQTGVEPFALQAFLAVTALSAAVAAAVVDERRQAEESLAVYRQFTDHAADAILFIRLHDGGIVNANRAAIEAYGYSLEEFLGMRLQDLVLPDDVGPMRERLVRADAEDLLFETVHRRRDGTTFPIEVHASSATLRGERVIFSVHRDLTARHEAEAARQTAEQATAHAQSRFKAVFDNVRDAVLVVEDGRFVVANPAAERLFGVAPGGLIGRSPASFSPETLPDGDSSAERVAATNALALAGTPQSFRWLHRRDDGTAFQADVGLTAAEYDGRRMVIAIVRDVTERLVLEDQLRQAQKMEAVGRLAGGVAHDFNNLLTVIKGYTELALVELSGRAPSEALEEVRKAGERATGLTRQLLAFSRKQILEPVMLDANGVVADLDRMLRRLIGEHIELMTVATAGVRPIYADRGQIEQVILNLALNARDAMPSGGRLTIETANAELDESYARQYPEVRPGAYAVIAVTDTGTGISAEAKPHIFEPFFTTKARGKGTGLGLSTVYGIVKQSGGHVTFYSETGRGTTFRVYLPAASRLERAETRQPLRGDPSRGRETILLVEDDPAVRGLAFRLLERWGYRVLVAAGGQEAIELSRRDSSSIDLLLTDVVMPRIGGREVARQLTAERPGVKVLFMSGYTENAIFHQGALEPGVDLIQKPFSPDALGRKIREVLERDAPAAVGAVRAE